VVVFLWKIYNLSFCEWHNVEPREGSTTPTTECCVCGRDQEYP